MDTEHEIAAMPQTRIEPLSHAFSRIGLGCWAIGAAGGGGDRRSHRGLHRGSHWGRQNVHDSRAAMQAALRRGVNHFDTADAFGGGQSESLIGEFLAQDYHRRENMCIATKVHAPEPAPEAFNRALDDSLDRLDIDTLDLLYIPWPFPRHDMRPMFEAIDEARRNIKLNAVGVAHFSIEQIEQVRQVCPIHACQLTYNLLWRRPEAELIPYCAEHDIAVVACCSIAQGLLSGAMPDEPAFARGDIRPTTVLFEPDTWPRVRGAADAMKAVAAEAGRPLLHLAVRWLMRNESVNTILVGARNARQLNEIAGAAHGDIDGAFLDRLTAISDDLQPHLPDAPNLFRRCP